jgi:hypothetical protein
MRRQKDRVTQDPGQRKDEGEKSKTKEITKDTHIDNTKDKESEAGRGRGRGSVRIRVKVRVRVSVSVRIGVGVRIRVRAKVRDRVRDRVSVRNKQIPTDSSDQFNFFNFLLVKGQLLEGGHHSLPGLG